MEFSAFIIAVEEMGMGKYILEVIGTLVLYTYLG